VKKPCKFHGRWVFIDFNNEKAPFINPSLDMKKNIWCQKDIDASRVVPEPFSLYLNELEY